MASILDLVERTEGLLLIGGGLLFVYWFMTSDATAEIRQTISDALPQGVGQVVPPAPGTEVSDGPSGTRGTTADGNTQYRVTASGAITVFIKGVPQSFGPGASVPGTNMTVSQLRTSGYTDSDIATLLDKSQI